MMSKETAYQVTMHMAREMLADGTITTEEYQNLEKIFSDKYSPTLGVLFSSLSLDFQAQQSDE